MFSIIVSVYRVEEYLRECIDSILAQTHREFEVILVDDGSPDRCGAICDEYAQKDMRVHVVHKPNGGLVSARKAGVAVSQGEYICFVDGDDFVATDMLETYDQIISNSKADIICTGFSKWFDNQTTQVIQNLEPGFYGNERLRAEIYPHMLSATPFFSFLVWPSVCAKCIRKEIIDGAYEKIPNDITMGEDVAVTYPALLQASQQRASVIFRGGYRCDRGL
jgi:glycosyltransferase involved in cell wall biosynthesis